MWSLASTSSFLLLSLALQIFANPIIADSQDILRPQRPLSDLHPGLSLDLDEQRLLQFEDGSRIWMSEWEKLQEKAEGRRFFDVTDTRHLDHSILYSPVPYKPLNLEGTVKGVITNLSIEGPKANLEKFTSFYNRYYHSSTGVESQKWLLSRISEITTAFASPELREAISVKEFTHSWPQSSIIARINGTSKSNEVIILGAHLDSINVLPWLAAPGADDDGSGTVTILEAYRALLSAGFRPNRTVEFHWYSAEEGGLLGSQGMAQAYKEIGVDVVAMTQMDITAWVKEGTREEVGVIVDYVDLDLTRLIEKMIDTYLDIPYVEITCGYACSDHGSWGKAGYRGSSVAESAYKNTNQHIHSGSDRIDISPEFSFEHMLEFSKLAVAFAIELGEWQNLE
ncbi:peptidase [Hysterangium stoloniferum]|nr:peptidase [Hysterangium stoloniferum]